MIRIIKADGEEKQFLAEVEKRAGQVNADVEKTVRAILADVKENGDAAVKSYTAKFDCPNAQYYRVPDEAIQDALTEANENSPEFVNAMLNAVENITAFHNRQARRLLRNRGKRRYHGSARERPRPRWSVRTRRHGCVPFLRADERNPGEDSRR